MRTVKICLLDDVAPMVLLLEDVLTLGNIPFDLCHTSSRLFELLDAKGAVLREAGYSVLLLGNHPSTRYSWQRVVERVRQEDPGLPILLISTEASCDEHIHHGWDHTIGVLRGPFWMKDLYAALRL